MEQNTNPTIQVSASGKVVVTNAKDIVLLDSDGNPIAKRNRFSLCNCGKTQDGPFCDGAHKQ
jgi:CDGSH-type Zn-finger protein